MQARSFRHPVRRGNSTVQTVVIVGLILLVVIATISTIGSNTKGKLTSTATQIGNPSALPSAFGS